MKKLSLLSLAHLTNSKQKQQTTHHSQDSSKKFSSFDILGKSPYKNSINSKASKLKEYLPITTRVHQTLHIKSPPQSCKASKQTSVSNAFSHLFDTKNQESIQKQQKKNYTYQLKNLLTKEKQSPCDLGLRMATQVSQTHMPLSPKGIQKTSPDIKQIYGEHSKLKNKVQIHNNTERTIQLETTRQKILALQLKIQGNILKRNQKVQNKKEFTEDIKTDKIIDLISKKPQLPQNTLNVLKHYNDQLSEYEKKEIIDYETIYYIPQKNIRLLIDSQKDEQQFNNGFDTNMGDYKFIKQDHIAYRYELIEKLGHGSFGYVFKVKDHKHKSYTALKIIKNKEKFYHQALLEIDILKIINKADPSCCLIKMLNYFEFRGHICIVFELLSCNLYEFIAINEFQGFDLDLIRRFAIQILQALLYLKEQNIIHCDLKPENVLLKDFNRSGIKIIDFGSSCYANQKMYSYIQSRFYRAPEIILGLHYSTQIDMWSFGCIIAELLTGQSLFQSKSEKELLYLQIKVLGFPDKKIIDQSNRKNNFFNENYTLNYQINESDLIVQMKPLNNLLEKANLQFQDFIKRCLTWNPQERMTPEKALIHPWIVEGLPDSIKKQHLQQMEQYLQMQSEVDIVVQPQGQGKQLE